MKRRTRAAIGVCAALMAVAAPAGGETGERALPRLLLVGLDGADLRIVDRMIGAGRLPALAGLMKRGLAGPLRTIHNQSPIIWTSIATGTRPAKHGITGFRPKGARGPANALDRRRPAFWNVLTHYGRSVGVMAWWVTFPAEVVDGFMVSPYVVFLPPEWKGMKPNVVLPWSREDPRRTFPPELQRELRPRMLDASDLEEAQLKGLVGPEGASLHTPWVVARDNSYYQAALYLLEQRPVETLAVYFQGIDVASHDFERHVFGSPPREQRVSEAEQQRAMARVEAMYVAHDQLLAGLLARIPPEADVIVVSDHGWEYDGTGHRNRNAGMFVAAGPSIASGRVREISVLDVAPILLAARGVPLSKQFDGKVVDGVLKPDVAAAVQWVDDYPIPPVAVPGGADGSAPEDERMLELLRRLGYIE